VKPLIGVLIGGEYTLNAKFAWQFGLAYYQASHSSVSGEAFQAPLLNPEAVNIWNYRYQILSHQLIIENKLFLVINHYHPYLLIGLGAGFNNAYGFRVTPQNAGEVATAIYNSHFNKSFIYTLGFGLDVDVAKHVRIGAGYRFAYLGKYNLAPGRLDTGVGGSVFAIPAPQSVRANNSEVLVQLTYLI
jgi:hypothetical protein